MLRHTTVSLVLVGVVTLASAGCGNASAEGGTRCQQMCQHWEDCPGLTWAVDCVSICEEAVQDAEVLGGTCPALLEREVACKAQLSCGEVYLRNTGGFYDDECVAAEAAVAQCVPASLDDVDEEFALACQAFCDAIDDCPALSTEPGCRDACISAFSAFNDGTELCTEAIINDVACQSSLDCGAIGNRINSVVARDACSDADAIAEAACF